MPQVTMTVTAHVPRHYDTRKVKKELEKKAQEAELERVFVDKNKAIVGWTSHVDVRVGRINHG